MTIENHEYPDWARMPEEDEPSVITSIRNGEIKLVAKYLDMKM